MKTSHLIIGAGPAGLAMAGRFSSTGIDYEILEQSDKVAVAWHNHYDRLHLHTVKQLSALPHMDFPDDYPVYVPRAKLVEYFQNYIQTFSISPHFNTEVKSLKKKTDNWLVKTNTGKDIIAKNVIIATGVNRNMNIPDWPGKDQYKGSIIHSRNYKNPLPYKNQKVLVIGMGNTGAEVALDLTEHDVETHLAVRGEVGLIPRDVNGQPVQLTARKLDKLPFGLGDWLGTQIRKVIIGDMSKYGLRVSKMHPAAQLKETGKTPVIDIGTAKAIKQGKIKVHPGIKEFKSDGVIFTNGVSESYDAIILATGYRADVQDYLESTDGLLDHNNLPKEKIGQGNRKGLYFLGYDNYKLGGIFGTIRDDSLLILNDIATQNQGN
ncbi:MAG: NAD(P)/FAD-dependent oxidoreductase [Saprospiraceae bacterium]|nr:NAD(P)/FAD-dependent oxidoreductase [Saprospiraceae bacterium]